MFREQLKNLQIWQKSKIRLPLILRGARQVGKSWLVDEFSKSFTNYIKINFERDRKAHNIFANELGAKKIIQELEIYSNQKIIPKQTLLFFDEAQACKNVLLALRYFKEETPDVHVICAGSLLDFCIDEIGMPVGRVQYLYLHPLSFYEFLLANNRKDLCELIKTKNISHAAHELINSYLKDYFWLGGMPAVIDTWIKSKDIFITQTMQNNIIHSYIDDFAKYAKTTQFSVLDMIFHSIPLQLGAKFKYTNVSTNLQSRDICLALNLLIKSGVAFYCYHTSGQSALLQAEINLKKFKIFGLDIGLLQKLRGLNLHDLRHTKLSSIHFGPICEQFVAQEYIAYTAINTPPALFYWHREAKSSNAEIDFIFKKNNNVVPVEVKSNTTGQMRSLHLFLQTHPQSSYGIKISENNFGKYGNIIEIPFYGIKDFICE